MSEAPQGWRGGRFGRTGTCVLAPNPGPMTLDGTNTWVLRGSDADRSIVIDPGPLVAEHLDAVQAVAGRVGLVLVTHHHHDHTEALAEFCERTGAPARALDPAWCVEAPALTDGELLTVDGLRVRALHTPGHTADSTSFVLPEEQVILTGDMVLGRGTTVVAHPDGGLGDYLASLERMRVLVEAGEIAHCWPAHGPVLDDAGAALDFYLAHRRDRLAQVQAALDHLGVRAGDVDLAAEEHGQGLPRRVVEVVYADVDTALWDAAELSVRAQLVYLADADRA